MIRHYSGKNEILLFIPFIAVLVVLSGCATMGKDECLNADWHTIGYEDGKNVHAAQIQVKGHVVDLKKMHDELRAVDKNLHDYEAELIHDDIGPRRRKKLLEEFKILTEQRRYLLDEIVQQEALLETSRQNLREVMAQNPY